MPTRAPTKPSTPRLSEIARHVIVPDRAVSTGWPAVRDKCAELGISFDPWQDGAGKVILAKRRTGIYAASIGGVVISIPRQVGKTFLIGAIAFALCLLHPGLTVIWTAHQLRTANETFRKMQGFAKRRRIKPHVAQVVLGSGDEEIRFVNGSRILFGARERGFGLGFDEVDVLVFDEGQRVTDKALDDMIPATNQSRQPSGALVLFIGTPPRPSDAGEAFRRKRTDALSGDDEDVAYIEFSADQDADPSSWEQVAKANPSFPHRTPREAILRMKRNLGAQSFMREGLGIWDPVAAPGPFRAGSWRRCFADLEEPPAPAALGVSADLEQIWLSLGAASDGEPMHLGSVVKMRVDEQRAEFVAEVKRAQDENGGIPVGLDGKGPASFLIDDFDEAGIYYELGSLDDYVQACTNVRTRVETGAAQHGDYDDLNDSVDVAGWRNVGKRRVFAGKEGEISMLEAVTWATWATQFGASDPYVGWT